MSGNFVSIVIALAVSIGYLHGADVRVTDIKGTAVEVRNVYIDYTVYPQFGVYSPDYERAGVRSDQGDGVVTIRWELIEQIVIRPVKPGVSPRRLEAEITLKNKKVLSLDLRNSEKGLYGTTDLGDFNIGLGHISTIAILPPGARR